MTLGGVTASYSTQTLSELLGVQQVGHTSAGQSQATEATASTSFSDSTEISGPAELYSKLQQLAASDPEKLKEVCASIADKVKTAAQNATGVEANMLNDLATKFQDVATGADVSELKPPGPPSSGGGPQGAIGAYAKQQGPHPTGLSSNGAGPGGPSEAGRQLMSSILDEVDKALSG